MRIDQRELDALRPVSIERHYIKHAPGSVLVSFGDTKVICTASYEPRVPPWMKDSGKGWITAEYGMLPGATHTRGNRDAVKKGRALEISRLIGRALRATVDLTTIGECQIIIDCDVIQADGGTRTAAITGAYVALYDALQSSVRAGNLRQMPPMTSCAAVSVGIVGGQALLDLDYSEDAEAEVDMNVVMNGRGAFIEVQGSAEKQPFSQDQMLEMLGMARNGIEQLGMVQAAALAAV